MTRFEGRIPLERVPNARGRIVYLWDGRPIRIEAIYNGSALVSEQAEEQIEGRKVRWQRPYNISRHSMVWLEQPKPKEVQDASS